MDKQNTRKQKETFVAMHYDTINSVNKLMTTVTRHTPTQQNNK